MNTLFVTGSTGLFGRWLLRDIPASVGSLILLDHKHEDMTSFTLPSQRVTHILHMATPPLDAPDYLGIVERGAMRVRDLAIRDGAKVLLTSSGAIYDQQTPYAYGKRSAELIFSDVKNIIARCYTFVGPNMPNNFAIENFIRGALTGRIDINGSAAVRSYMHADDLSRWAWDLLLGDHEGVFDVGSDEAVDMVNLAKIVKRVVNHTCEINIHGYGGTRYVPNVDRARAVGFNLRVGLEEAIAKTAEDMKYA